MFSFTATFFQAFNVPVFWPILVLYFCILFGISMKRQIKVNPPRATLFANLGRPGGLSGVDAALSSLSAHSLGTVSSYKPFFSRLPTGFASLPSFHPPSI